MSSAGHVVVVFTSKHRVSANNYEEERGEEIVERGAVEVIGPIGPIQRPFITIHTNTTQPLTVNFPTL